MALLCALSAELITFYDDACYHMHRNEFEGLAFETGGPRRGPVAKTGAEALERFGLGTITLQEIVHAQANIIGICWFLSYLGLSLTRQRFMVMREP